MESMRKIVNFAFRRVDNLEETTTPFRLVDEMLDHYRKEVIKFSTECTNYHIKFEQFLAK